MKYPPFTVVALVGLASVRFLPASTATTIVHHASLGYLTLGIIIRIRAGYLRRRPHWTSESWRRYLLACSVPVLALLIVFGMAWSVDQKLQIAGESGSITRGICVAVMVISMLVGIIGFAFVLGWLTDGDPSRQFTWPRRRRSA